MRRRSPVYLLVAALALATGLVLDQMAALLTDASPVPSRNAATAGPAERLVGAFYDAVDAAFRGGQGSDLDRLLAPDFVEHGGPATLPPSRAGLLRHLRALAVAFPALRLREEDAFAHGDLVVARVGVAGADRGAFLGLTLPDPPPPWGAVDVFRVAAGAIAEHWGGDAAAPLLEPLGAWPFTIPPVPLQTLALTRTALATGARVGLGSGLGPAAAYVEAGRVAVAVFPSAPTPARLWRAGAADENAPPTAVSPGAEASLGPGDVLLLPQGTGGTATAEGGTAATLLTVGLDRSPGRIGPATAAGAVPAIAASPVAAPGIAIADLAGSLPVALPGGPGRLGLGRVTLAPGAALPIRAPGVALLAVEAGSLALANAAGVVWSRRSVDGTVTTATDGTRTAGDAVVVEAGAGIEVRSVGDAPLVLLVATIAPGP
jgi:hypothetical protein